MTMAITRSDRVFTLLYGAGPPTADEWAHCLSLFRERGGLDSRFLVETHGGGPDPKQRKELTEILRDQDALVAVLTDSLVARGIITAFAWLGLPQRGFPLGDVRGAGSYLGLSNEELQHATTDLMRLRAELGLNGKRQVTG